jgi:hypothetical protein
MDTLTIGLREKFLRFRQAYETARERIEAAGAAGHIIASLPWEEALKEVPLHPAELRLYKQLVAMHSVNGGELFGNDDDQ